AAGRLERSGLVGEAAVVTLLGDQRSVDLEDRGDRPCLGGRRRGQARRGVGEQRVPLVDQVEALGGDLCGYLRGGRGDGLLALRAGPLRQAVTAHLEIGEVGRDVVVRAGAEDGHLVAVGAQSPDHLLDVHGGSLGAEHSDAGVEQGVGDPHDWVLPGVEVRAAGTTGEVSRADGATDAVTWAAGATGGVTRAAGAGGGAGGRASSAAAAGRDGSACSGAGEAGAGTGSSIGWVGMWRWPERSARARRRRAWSAESYSAVTSSRAAS